MTFTHLAQSAHVNTVSATWSQRSTQGGTPRKAVLLGSESASGSRLHARLIDEGYSVRSFPSPHQFFRDLHSFSPCLVVVCVPFEEVTHEPVLRRIRELFGHSAPIIVVGAEDDASHHLGALEAGADDFVVRSTPMDIVMARVRALTRRYPGAPVPTKSVRVDDYLVDFQTQSVTVAGRKVSLTPKEFDLFWVFASSMGRLISKKELLTCVWGQNCELDTHTVSQHVHALRRKLRLSENGLQLTALYGAGYRLERVGGFQAPVSVPELDDSVGMLHRVDVAGFHSSAVV